MFKYDAYDGVICHLENIITDKPYLDFYRVFLTQAEAEMASKKNGKGGVRVKGFLKNEIKKLKDNHI